MNHQHILKDDEELSKVFPNVAKDAKYQKEKELRILKKF